MVMGTVGYMSPEQVRGKTADHRSDIFAFGTILYEMVTGKQTFRKPTSAETMTAILNEDPPSISQIAPGLASGIAAGGASLPGEEPGAALSVGLRYGLRAGGAVGLGDHDGHLAATHTDEPKPNRRRNCDRGSGAALCCSALRYWLISGCVPNRCPRSPISSSSPTTANRKSLVGTEGSRLYLYLQGRDYQGMAEMSTSGGEPRKLSILPSAI